ncbi:MAG: sensor histidine kinase [Bdellovibrionales bacterium]
MERSEPNRQGRPKPTPQPQNLSAALELQRSEDRIKQAWEKKVRLSIPSSEGKTSLVLRNTLGVFLEELISILKQDQSQPDDQIYLGMSKAHGAERASFTGYFLPQLLKEFSLLREVLNETLHTKDLLTYEVRSCIDKAIDTVISLAATQFAAVQHADTKAALLRSESSNMDLERFASVAAHDLKSPLVTITGYLTLLEEEFSDKLGQEGAQFIHLMMAASERMRSLINSLLDYSRLSNTQKSLKPTNMNHALQAALQNLAGVMTQTRARVTSTQLPIVQGDLDLLTQLFQNLIDNSIKFRSERPPQITIEASDQGTMWTFQLKDNGIGFDTNQSGEIFTLYKKLHGEGVYQGSGIGLASCRKVLELHGGKIWAESKKGIGSTFHFTLPKK